MARKHNKWGNATPEEVEQKVHVAIHNEGLFAEHNLVCWFCNEEPAVFMLHPYWCFYPCWSCQKRYKGVWSIFNTKRPLPDDPQLSYRVGHGELGVVERIKKRIATYANR